MLEFSGYRVMVIEETQEPFMILYYEDEETAKNVARNLQEYYKRNNWEIKLQRMSDDSSVRSS